MTRLVPLLAIALTLWLALPAPGQTPYFPPPGGWTRRAPAELGMNPTRLAEAIDFARSQESTREVDFSDQERIFGALLGSIPTRRASTNGVVIYKGYVVADSPEHDLPEHDMVVVWRWHRGNEAELVRRIIAAITS